MQEETKRAVEMAEGGGWWFGVCVVFVGGEWGEGVGGGFVVVVGGE